MNICDCELVTDFDWIRNKKIVLYGAGYWGKRVFHILHGMGIGVVHVVATTARKGEMFTNGIKVEQVSVVAPQINHPDYLVIICSHQYREEMLAHLDSLGIGMENGAQICRLRAFNAAILMNEKETNIYGGGTKEHESARKVNLYKEMHHNNDQYGIGAIHFLPLVACCIEYLKPNTILDYGCGKGLLVDVLKKRYPHIESHGFDPAIPGRDKLPFDNADFLICTDVLEHIPEDDLPTTIQSIQSISNNVFFALNHGLGDILPNGENAHCTVKPIAWYYRLFREYFPRLVCLPVDHVRSVVITFDVPQDVLDAYMRVLASDLFF